MAAKKLPLVSIVILNWNGLEDTKLCLEYVRKLDYNNFEIIVVDNGSSVDEKEYLSKQKDIIYVDNEVNRGFAGGQSDGYKKSNGDFILLLNNDAVIKSDYLREAMPLFNDPKVAVVGGRSYFWNDNEELLDESNHYYAHLRVNPISAETDLLMQDRGVVEEVNTVSGSAVIVRRSVIDEVGYLWEPFFAYYEESDLFARIKRAGYKVLYSPKLRIWHQNGASSGAQGGSKFFFYHIFRNRFMYAFRNFEGPYLRRFLADYYRQGLRSIIDMPSGAVQQRLGASYAKAFASTALKLPKLLQNRRELSRELGPSSYVRQIIREQTNVSVVLDATGMTVSRAKKLVDDMYAKKDVSLEYVIVVDHDMVSPDINFINIVVDRKYFSSPPINLGCLAAKYDWMVIASAKNIPEPSNYIKRITERFTSGERVIDLPDTPKSIAIHKHFYEQIGGVALDQLNDLRAYALDKKEYSSVGLDISDTDKNHIRKIRKQNDAINARLYSSRYQKFLASHYRMQQLSNLMSWLANTSISPRLKLARMRNLFKYTASLKRQELATELRHIRNEATRSDQKTSAGLFDKGSKLREAVQRAAKDVFQIPIFIICFERVDSLKTLVKNLEKAGYRKIILIDNGSIYPPLVKFYQQTPYQVLRLNRNAGHTAPWTLAIIRTLMPHDFYIVTDPDVLPVEECPDDFANYLLSVHEKYPDHLKVGLGLKIDDLPNHYPLKDDVVAWEAQFWTTELESGVFEAGVDTTFAMYKPGSYAYLLHPSLRTGEPYLARHLPWYTDPNHQTDEDAFYKMRADQGITSWNVDDLPERYKKEMEK